MAGPLGSKQLHSLLLQAIDESGWQAVSTSQSKPFVFQIFRADQKGFKVAVYIWNCTHGGGAARAADEYRVQITGVVPELQPETTLLLGWHRGYGVFVAFDITKHSGQDSSSPSIQVAEECLQAAHTKAFSLYTRRNGETAVAFRPEFFVDYSLNSKSLHLTGKAASDLSLLNDLEHLTDEKIAALQNRERRIVVSQIARKYRAVDFRKRVLGAYGHQCAVCGVQLNLIDAAHIIPVAHPASTDETLNGVAMCKLHHAAFDRNLLSFDEKYKVEISTAEISRLTAGKVSGGLSAFKSALKTALILPNDKRDYPPPSYIKEARAVRRWGS